jgi:catechol 2,3-dioxygenase-like lactoylglutathione lyase family enzyme
MKRFHVHVGVANLDQSIQFYAAMFGAPPTIQKKDYAKWMLEDPRVNFAISARGTSTGVNHLGMQAESAEELAEIHSRLQAADDAVVAEEGANCCYAKSDKYWVQDPSGIAWESFHTLGSVPFFSGETVPTPAVKLGVATVAPDAKSAACCAPKTVTVAMPKLAAKPMHTGCCNG